MRIDRKAIVSIYVGRSFLVSPMIGVKVVASRVLPPMVGTNVPTFVVLNNLKYWVANFCRKIEKRSWLVHALRGRGH